MSILKDIFKVFNGSSWDEHYFKTSSDQVVHTKSDGTATTVQEELLAQNSAMKVKETKITSYYSTLPIKAQKFGNCIEINLSSELAHSMPANQVIEFATLPTEYTPQDIVTADVFLGFERAGTILINENGKIELYLNQLLDLGWFRFNVAYIK